MGLIKLVLAVAFVAMLSPCASLNIKKAPQVRRNFTIEPRENPIPKEMDDGGFLDLKHRRPRPPRPRPPRPRPPRPVPCTGSTPFSLSPGQSVRIQSLKYPNKFPAKYSCEWNFVAVLPGITITISCNRIALKGCSLSKLEIEGGSLSKRICGTKNSIEETSSGNSLSVSFTTKNVPRRKRTKGFSCTITASEETTEPEVTTTTQPSVETPATSDDCTCGLLNSGSRIVGGTQADANEYPWQVGLTAPTGNRPYCGGSIISNQWIMTAAHCVDGDGAGDLSVVLAEHNWMTTGESDSYEKKAVTRVIVHPEYNSNNYDNDIALLRLATPIVFPGDNTIAQVCLPTDITEEYVGVPAIVTGWGTLFSGATFQPSILNEVTVPTISNAQCEFYYSATSITENMICAGLPQGGVDSCQGDSGGPLIAEIGNTNYFEQIGVVSWGSGCGDAGYPGVYARVTQYLSWINEYISDSTICSRPT